MIFDLLLPEVLLHMHIASSYIDGTSMLDLFVFRKNIHRSSEWYLIARL